MIDQLNPDDSDVDDLNTSIIIIKRELTQFSLVFNNCKAMTKQMQSLAAEIAQFRQYTPAESRIPAIPVPKILQSNPFTGDRLELDIYLIHCQHIFLTQFSLFLTEQYKILYIIFYLKDIIYS